MTPSPNPASRNTFLRRLPRSEQLGRGARRALWIAGIALVLYALVLGEGGWLRVAQLQGQVDELQSDIQWLHAQQDRVREDLRALDVHGGDALEKVARERYGLLKEGERVVHVLGSGDTSQAPEAPALSPRDEAR